MAKEITVNILKILSEKKTSRGTNRMRIVQYNEGSPQLEKREFWVNDEDQEMPGKAKGMTAEDFEVLIQNAEEIKKLLTGTPKTE
jgi:hypothetical protein